jgi:adenylate cyclase
VHLHTSVRHWLEELRDGVRQRLSVRIGGHVGAAVLSRLGPAHHQHITATGDTVNVASRLLEVAKEQSCALVITEELHEASQYAWSAAGPLCEVPIRGRSGRLRLRTLQTRAPCC